MNFMRRKVMRGRKKMAAKIKGKIATEEGENVELKTEEMKKRKGSKEETRKRYAALRGK